MYTFCHLHLLITYMALILYKIIYNHFLLTTAQIGHYCSNWFKFVLKPFGKDEKMAVSI